MNTDEKLNRNLKEEILQKWEENFQVDGGGIDTNDYKIRSEKRSISTKGELQIKWPKAVNPQDNKRINELDFLINKKDLSVELLVDNNLSLEVDSDRISQVFTNLFSNAIKFSPPNGKIKITCLGIGLAVWMRYSTRL